MSLSQARSHRQRRWWWGRDALVWRHGALVELVIPRSPVVGRPAATSGTHTLRCSANPPGDAVVDTRSASTMAVAAGRWCRCRDDGDVGITESCGNGDGRRWRRRRDGVVLGLVVVVHDDFDHAGCCAAVDYWFVGRGVWHGSRWWRGRHSEMGKFLEHHWCGRGRRRDAVVWVGRTATLGSRGFSHAAFPLTETTHVHC